MIDRCDGLAVRPPFLLIDHVIAMDDRSIKVAAFTKADGELLSRIYAGHFPQFPVTPGILLCEMVFQAGALLLAREPEVLREGLPVLVKIKDARFRQIVPPNAALEIDVTMKERASNAFQMVGTVRHNARVAVRVEYTGAVRKWSLCDECDPSIPM